jgi:acetyl-CoA C-acetyltransferase
MRVQTGIADVVIAGGTESMSQVEHYTTRLRWGVRAADIELVDRLGRARVTAGGRDHPIPGGMLETAEHLRRDGGIERRAPGRARAALARTGRGGAARGAVRRRDRAGRRHGSPRERHASRSRRAPACRHHARGARCAAPGDGARGSRGDRDGRQRVGSERRRGRVRGHHPGAGRRAGTAPARVAAVVGRGRGSARADGDRSGARERVGARPSGHHDGSARPDRAQRGVRGAGARGHRHLGHRPAGRRTFNPNGSGISLGHPVGATGARILATMLRELDRREGRYALETMCVGGGQGIAAVFERVG